MENFEDRNYVPKEDFFGKEYLEVKLHDFSLEEAEWYLGERPYDELDGKIGNAVIAIKSFIRNGKIDIPADLGSNKSFEVESELRKLLEEEEPGVYFGGPDTPLSIRISAMQNALEPKGDHNENEVYNKLWALFKKRYGLSSEENNEDAFVMWAVQNLGYADYEFKAFGSPKSKFGSILKKWKKPEEGQE